ncbi:unnamed protein product [Ectocarpus sp. 4 AP-2014]
MKRKATKRKPIPLVPPAIRSRKKARQIVTTFHKLEKEADEVSSSTAPDKQARLERLERELDEMGGREAYQSASLLSVSFHNTSKWVTKQLAGKLGLRPANGEPPLRVLEVGAINTRLLDVPWLDVRAIDLKSQHPRIEERDFFSLEPAREYDVVSSSMVINCVPTAKGRYEMLVGYRNHLRNSGHLFLVLPLLCLTKSTRTTRASFLETLSRIGFTVVAKKETPKVAFFCLRNTPLEALDVQGGGSSLATKEGGTRGAGAAKGTSGKRNRGANDFAVSP